MSPTHLDHPVLKGIIAGCEDKFQGYAAFNLYLRLREQFKLDEVNWKFEPSLKMVLLESKHKGISKVFLPLHFTYRPSPKWIREATGHVTQLYPQASFHLAFTSSSETFVIYRTNMGLEMPNNINVEDLQKVKSSVDNANT